MSIESSTPVVDIGSWVERARHDPQRYLERQATEILLAAIGASASFGEKLYLKGGVLMGVVYNSPRQTADIDFTATIDPTDQLIQELRTELDVSLQREAAQLGYPDLVCRIQNAKRKPREDNFEKAIFPALLLSVAYARRDSPAYTRLENGMGPAVLKLEISFNEPVRAVQLVRLSDSASIQAYGLVELIAEKLRALLQQVPRNRNRRQDIYDIAFLIRNYPLDADEKKNLLDRLLEKGRIRNIEPSSASLSNPEVRKRARSEWETLRLELGELPDFDEAYTAVEIFYGSLPW